MQLLFFTSCWLLPRKGNFPSGLYIDSLQGDARQVDLWRQLGVTTEK